MKANRIIYIAKEPFRKIRKSNRVFLNDYVNEFKNFLGFVVLGGIIAYFLAEIIINLLLADIELTATIQRVVWTLKVLIAIFTGVVCGSFYLPFYTFYRCKYAFNHLFRLRGDNLNPNYRQTILVNFEDRINTQLSKLATLTKEGELKTDYSTQFFLADMFSANISDYFWATSFDRPSEFPIRNFGYMRKFNSMELIGLNGDNIPKKARVFISTFDDLIEDIADNSAYLLELIRTHLHYHEKEVICSVKFIISPNDNFTQIEDIVQTSQIERINMIYDFFVADDKLVYGRKNKRLNRVDEEIDISFIGNSNLLKNETPEDISKYKEIFHKIWNISYDVKALSSQLLNIDATNEFSNNANAAISKLASYQILDEIKKKILRFANDALNLWENIEDTQRKIVKYANTFDNARFGQSFFSKWLNIIESSKGIAWAVDSSERKEGNEFYKIWDNENIDDYVYREFFKSSGKAAIGGCEFTRVFIINSLIPKGEQEEKFRLFLYKTIVTNKLKIGIILSEKANLTEDEKLNFGDFLMVGISKTADFYDINDAKGFTLRNKKFKVDDLNFDYNIMLEKDLDNYKKIFQKLWNNIETIKFETEMDIVSSTKINKIIKSEL